MSRFVDAHELIRHARLLIDERLESLQRDVPQCLSGTHAPFPAMLYCFATIDLLGALASGNASRAAKSTVQSKDYLRRFMHYSQEHCELLMDLFRHKLVHLAQPSPIVERNGQHVSWGCWHEDSSHHLQVVPLPVGSTVQITASWSRPCTHRFEVSISHMVRDIVRSAQDPGGYLHSLSQDADLQCKFGVAFEQIHEQ